MKAFIKKYAHKFLIPYQMMDKQAFEFHFNLHPFLYNQCGLSFEKEQQMVQSIIYYIAIANREGYNLGVIFSSIEKIIDSHSPVKYHLTIAPMDLEKQSGICYYGISNVQNQILIIQRAATPDLGKVMFSSTFAIIKLVEIPAENKLKLKAGLLVYKAKQAADEAGYAASEPEYRDTPSAQEPVNMMQATVFQLLRQLADLQSKMDGDLCDEIFAPLGKSLSGHIWKKFVANDHQFPLHLMSGDPLNLLSLYLADNFNSFQK